MEYSELVKQMTAVLLGDVVRSDLRKMQRDIRMFEYSVMVKRLTDAKNDGLTRTTKTEMAVEMLSRDITPFSEVQKQKLEQLLLEYPYKDLIGMTLVDEVLVIRVLGDHIEPILENFTSLWTQLRTLWLQRSACAPRIWDT